MEFDIAFPLDKIIARKSNLWRYQEALPIESSEHINSFDEGMTPLVQLMYKEFDLMAKVDFLLPSGSFKDRGATVLTSFMKEIGIKSCIEDSSGNAGSALAAYTAKGNIECEIYCPEYTSSAKLFQISSYGAKLNRIPGTRADTENAVLENTNHKFYASHNWNPFFLEGIKTCAYEIAEQLNWKAPDNVICPLGFGGLFLGLYKGFKELLKHGLISKMPKLLGVQSEACCPVYQAYRHQSKHINKFHQDKPTLAEGICATKPMRDTMILRALSDTQGAVTIVSDKELQEGIRILATQGLFVEPTSAVVVKALDHFHAERVLSEGDKTIVILTGTGLKALSGMAPPWPT